MEPMCLSVPPRQSWACENKDTPKHNFKKTFSANLKHTFKDGMALRTTESALGRWT